MTLGSFGGGGGGGQARLTDRRTWSQQQFYNQLRSFGHDCSVYSSGGWLGVV